MGSYEKGEEFAYAYRPNVEPINMILSYGFVAEHDSPFAILKMSISNLFS